MSQEAALRTAVKRVIDQNRSIGYTPSRFIQATEDGMAINIFDVCERLLTSPETLEHLEPAVTKYRTLLTLEDEVARDPTALGLSEAAHKSANERVQYFTQICPGRRP